MPDNNDTTSTIQEKTSESLATVVSKLSSVTVSLSSGLSDASRGQEAKPLIGYNAEQEAVDGNCAIQCALNCVESLKESIIVSGRARDSSVLAGLDGQVLPDQIAWRF